MTNRIEKFLENEDVQSVLKAPLVVADPEKVIEGPKTYHTLLQEEIERAKQEGRQEVWDKIAEQISGRIESYIAGLVKLGNVVHAICLKALPQVEIVKYRAQLSFDSKWMRVMFVINATPEDQINFANLVNSAEKVLSSEDGFFCNVMYLNERDREIDQLSLKSDYPFALQLPSNKSK